MMQVFKFGGASCADAKGIKNLAAIISSHTGKQLLVVVSAMGKITNALEELTRAYIQGQDTERLFGEIKAYHEQVMTGLFNDSSHPVFDEIANVLVEIDWILEEPPHDDHDFIYDQIVSVGELVSSKIISAYLVHTGLDTAWLDARSFIHTDNSYRRGSVDWDKSRKAIQDKIPSLLQRYTGVTQGFIGGTSENYTTTLGREGSDYSAAIFASCLGAESVTIWKDVPGVLNADPKLFENTIKYDELSYFEALEMTYYGATVIHPKTIKPLQNAGIPLWVKPFMAPSASGTIIHSKAKPSLQIPAIIIKNNQVLVSLTTRDHSFITEDHLSNAFSNFSKAAIRINLVQNSAISFSVCFDQDEHHFKQLSEQLEEAYTIKFNTGLSLITVRHFKKELIDQLTSGKIVLLEQLSRNTAQYVVKESGE